MMPISGEEIWSLSQASLFFLGCMMRWEFVEPNPIQQVFIEVDFCHLCANFEARCAQLGAMQVAHVFFNIEIDATYAALRCTSDIC